MKFWCVAQGETFEKHTHTHTVRRPSQLGQLKSFVEGARMLRASEMGWNQHKLKEEASQET